MATSFSIDHSTEKIIRPTAILYCSSFEVTSEKLPKSTSTEYWGNNYNVSVFSRFQFKHGLYRQSIKTYKQPEN